MTSQRKLAANRANARASTGPRSARGKQRSARNARRHGLAIPIWSDVKLAAKAERLARAIAGPRSPPALLALARLIAEAQIDLVRVRQTQRDLIEPGFTSSAYSPCTRKYFPNPNSLKELLLLVGPPCPEKLALVLADSSQQLEAIDRYERRALSRRKFAIRAFDAARGHRPD